MSCQTTLSAMGGLHLGLDVDGLQPSGLLRIRPGLIRDAITNCDVVADRQLSGMEKKVTLVSSIRPNEPAPWSDAPKDYCAVFKCGRRHVISSLILFVASSSRAAAA